MGVYKIEHHGRLFGLIISHDNIPPGVEFYTSKEDPLQVGKITHKKGIKIRPHIHKKNKRIIESVHEVLYIQRGKIKALFYDERGAKIEECPLCEGDTVVLMEGGHGFEILEDCQILEIKQGPYVDKAEDKEYLQ
jgi:cupin fold WbuC family metalloprotein